MPSRRAYLATLAGVGLTGCVADSSGPTTASDPPSRPAVTVEAASVQYAFRHIENVDWNGIQPARGQFVFVTVDASTAQPVPGREAFTLVADDERYDPTAVRERYPVDLDVPGGPYTPERDESDARGWLAFDVPARLDAPPSLRLAGDADSWEWELDTEKATAPPPAWEWTASAPETVRPTETFDIAVSAENVGDGPGTFRGAVNFSHPLYHPKGFDIVLGPGESDRATVSARTKNADPGRELGYGVRTPAGESEVSVTVAAESTATERTN